MEKEEKVQLTKDWVAIMLYAGNKSLANLVKEGCKIMVYGWSYKNFVKIIEEMQAEGVISGDSRGYILSTEGLFNVKRRSIVPLLNLVDDAEYLQKFVQQNQTQCDVDFISTLANQGSEENKENYIINFARKNYDKIAIILNELAKYGNSSPSV